MRTAEQGSFARAGKALGVHGSAISKSVARLEVHLGLRLFHRTTRSLSLTAEGRVYYEKCPEIFGDLDKVERTMASHSGVPHARLTIILPVALGREHILPKLSRLFAAYPDVELVVHLEDRQVDLVSEGIDAAVRIPPAPDSSLVGRRLADVRYVVCASEAYLTEMGTPNTSDELSRHRCMTLVPSIGGRPSPWRFAEGKPRLSFDLPVPSSLQLNNAEALVEAAVQGAGLVQLHAYLAEPAIAAGKLRPVLEAFVSADGPPISILYPSARQMPATVRMFVDFIIDMFASDPPRATGDQTLQKGI